MQVRAVDDHYCPAGEGPYVPSSGTCDCSKIYCAPICSSDADCPTGQTCSVDAATDGGHCSGYHLPFTGLTLTAGQEVFLNMYVNPTIGTPVDNDGKITVTYKTVGTGNGILQRKTYWIWESRLASTTSFTLPASASVFSTVTLRNTDVNGGWTGDGAATLKIKNAGTNTILISSLTVNGISDTKIMGTYPQASCGAAGPCTEGNICYQNVCRKGCSTNWDCPDSSHCEAVACITSLVQCGGFTCAAGEVCVGNACRMGCTTDANCAAGLKCQSGACVLSSSSSSTCQKTNGDANCDGKIDEADYTIWKGEYLAQVTTHMANFNGDDKINLIDFEIWRSHKYQ